MRKVLTITAAGEKAIGTAFAMGQTIKEIADANDLSRKTIEAVLRGSFLYLLGLRDAVDASQHAFDPALAARQPITDTDGQLVGKDTDR